MRFLLFIYKRERERHSFTQENAPIPPSFPLLSSPSAVSMTLEAGIPY
jgi:hypothetical protein